MFIRQTRTNNKATGESYFTHRLVRTERIGGKVRQVTLLNLGRHFPIRQEDWPLLCRRIEELIGGQAVMIQDTVPEAIEKAAQRYAGRLIEMPQDVASESGAATDTPGHDFQEVDIGSLQLMKPRSVGVESLGLYALSQLGFVEKLSELGVNGVMRAAILGNVIGRMTKPASELATWNWLQQHSALGELIDFDFEAMPHTRLYHASDVLMKHRQIIEDHIFSAVQTLFGLDETVTLYDLTNTYFEGDVEGNEKAQRGHSKEKRSDCPLVTLGLVLDGSGFVRRSKTFAGNVAECGTLEVILKGLNAPQGALVIMDRGIATEANVGWLIEHGYRYLVVSRDRVRKFDEIQGISIETAGGDPLRIQKEISEDGKEVRLYCHSLGREKKESAMVERFATGFEAGLKKIVEGLAKPRGEKRYGKLLERIGRLKEKSRGAGQHYQVELIADESGKLVTGLAWKKVPVDGTMATHPGIYCLRSNETTWDEEKLWRTYTMLTDLESVFRSLKSELGLCPVYHSKEERADGHLFITVLAYQAVQVLRAKLKKADIRDNWASLRETMSVQRRVTASFQQRDGRTLNVRKCTVAEPDLMKIYRALGVSPAPGGTKKLIS
ncbi:IS1634 family transposase [Ferrovum myxofaciens]|uniref:IS1634 family transposase n=1 Tax=Ferrovum myxofaciens TaxID=416213 RepID=UPI003EBBFADB